MSERGPDWGRRPVTMARTASEVRGRLDRHRWPEDVFRIPRTAEMAQGPEPKCLDCAATYDDVVDHDARCRTGT